MKIGCLVSSLSRNAGGVYDSVRRLCQALAAYPNTEVHVLGMADEATSRDAKTWEPLATHVFRTCGPKGYGFAPGFKRRLFELDVDLLLTNGLWMYPTSVSLDWHRATLRPFVVNPHGMLDPWALRRSAWKKRFVSLLHEDAALRSAACLRALNQAELVSFRKYGLTNPTCVVSNGIDLPSKSDNGHLSSKSWPRSRSKTLLFLGRIHPKKGLALLLEAWARLRRSQTTLGADWQLVIAGWDFKGHENHLKFLARRWNLTDCVHFAGPLFGAEKAAAFRSAEAFVLPSHSEGMPMAVLEAWSHGLPVLMTPQCNLHPGFACQAAIRAEPHAESLACGLATLFACDHKDLRRMGERGRDLVAENYTWAQMGARMHTVCRWLLGERERPPCVTRSESNEDRRELILT